MKHISWDVVMEVGQWLGWPIEKSALLPKKTEKKQDKKEKNDRKIRKLGARILDFRGTS